MKKIVQLNDNEWLKSQFHDVPSGKRWLFSGIAPKTTPSRQYYHATQSVSCLLLIQSPIQAQCRRCMHFHCTLIHSFCKPFVCTNAHMNAYMRLIYTRVSMHVFSHAAFYFVLRVSLAMCCERCVFIYTCKFVCRIFKVLRYGSVVHLHKHRPSVRPFVRHTDSSK